MYAELGTAAGSITAMGFLFYFINVKVNKKQDKNMCSEISNTIKDDLKSGQEKFNKIMDTLTEIKVDNAKQFGKINQQLKDLNGKN